MLGGLDNIVKKRLGFTEQEVEEINSAMDSFGNALSTNLILRERNIPRDIYIQRFRGLFTFFDDSMYLRTLRRNSPHYADTLNSTYQNNMLTRLLVIKQIVDSNVTREEHVRLQWIGVCARQEAGGMEIIKKLSLNAKLSITMNEIITIMQDIIDQYNNAHTRADLDLDRISRSQAKLCTIIGTSNIQATRNPYEERLKNYIYSFNPEDTKNKCLSIANKIKKYKKASICSCILMMIIYINSIAICAFAYFGITCAFELLFVIALCAVFSFCASQVLKHRAYGSIKSEFLEEWQLFLPGPALNSEKISKIDLEDYISRSKCTESSGYILRNCQLALALLNKGAITNISVGYLLDSTQIQKDITEFLSKNIELTDACGKIVALNGILDGIFQKNPSYVENDPMPKLKDISLAKFIENIPVLSNI